MTTGILPPRLHGVLSLLLALGLGAAFDTGRCAAQDRFVPDPGGEGTLDTTTGLIWGFDLFEAGEYLQDVGIHVGGGTSYTWLGAYNLSLNCYDENGDPLPEGFCTYPEFSAWYSGEPSLDWRLPTKDELVEAAQAGLIFDYDKSPHDGLQMLDPANEPVLFWSATTKRVRGQDKAYAVDLFTGGTSLIGVGSAIRGAIPVRGVEPPADDSGPGNGNGKNK